MFLLCFFTYWNFLSFQGMWPYSFEQIWKMLVHYIFDFPLPPFWNSNNTIVRVLRVILLFTKARYVFVSVSFFPLHFCMNKFYYVCKLTDTFSVVFDLQTSLSIHIMYFGFQTFCLAPFNILYFTLLYVHIYINS